MAPPARSFGTSLAGARVGAGGATPFTATPFTATPEPTGFALTAAELLVDDIGRHRSPRGRRVLVGGTWSAPAGRRLCDVLARSARCIWLDLTSAARFGPGLSDVLGGVVPLSRGILARESGFDRLHGGPGHPDALVERPHALAIALDALSFAYDLVVMSAPEREDSLLAEVLAAISDAAVLSGGFDAAAERAEALAYAARGAGRVGLLALDGRTTWLRLRENALAN